MANARTRRSTSTPSAPRRHLSFRFHAVLAGLLGLGCALSPALTADAWATVAPRVVPQPYTYSVEGGTTFGIVANVQILDGPEAQPITVTVTHDTSDPADFPPLITFLDVPAQPDPNWNCSGSNLAIQTVMCVYTPTPGSPVQPNTVLSLNIDGTAPAAPRGTPP